MSERCDHCGRTPAPHIISRFGLRFCTPCGKKMSVWEALERKHGPAEARLILEMGR